MSKQNGNTLKSSNKLSVLLFMLLGGACGFIGVNVLDHAMGLTRGNKMGVFIAILVILLSMYLSIFLQIIIHEAGHLVCGIFSGYKFVSFRIISFILVNIRGVYKLKRFNIKGTGGQCLMMPPGSDGNEFPFVLYNLGGIIANIVFSLLCIMLYKLMPHVNYFSLFLAISSLIGIAFAMINGIPLYIGGIANDGRNALSLGKDNTAKRAFWLQLYINGLIANGTRLAEMDEKLFKLPEEADLNNPIICTMEVYKCCFFHDKRLFDEALATSEYLLENAPGMLAIHKNELRCELLFYEMIGQCRKEEIDRLYTEQLRRYIKATSLYVSRRRLMYAYALLVERDKSKAATELESFEQTAKTYPYEIEVQGERELIEIIDRQFQLIPNETLIPLQL